MTKRAGMSASNDDVLAGVMNANTPAVCLVGKTHDFHVKTALNISLEDNIANIRQSIEHIVRSGREAHFDAEHFFDGYLANADYALSCIQAAYAAGARWIALCDTNGGRLPFEVFQIVSEVVKHIPNTQIGIHTHDDTGHAVANTFAAVDAGARLIQGTLNGLGERCGNANLVTIIPTLLLKYPYASKYEIGISQDKLKQLSRTSHTVDELLNRAPNRHAPYVGKAAFAHKAGLHASAIAKDPTTYEHVDPASVGNQRIIPMSNQAGKSNLLKRLAVAGIDIDPKDPRIGKMLKYIKEKESLGFAYDMADASFHLLALEFLGQKPKFFDIERYRVTVEHRHNARNELITVSEAVVVATIDGERKISASESFNPDQGPVNALFKALAKDLGKYQTYIDDLRLIDYKVRILSGGTEAVTRVLIESTDSQRRRWTTVGVSANIVDASFQALIDSIRFKLLQEQVD
jgi:2-isopropylmalate synthase